MTTIVDQDPSWDPAAVVEEVLQRLPGIRRTAPPLVRDDLIGVLADAEHATDEEVAVLANLVALLGADDAADLVTLHDLVGGLGLAGLIAIQRRLLGGLDDDSAAALSAAAVRRLGEARGSLDTRADALDEPAAEAVVDSCRDVAAGLVVTGRSMRQRRSGDRIRTR